MIKKRLIYLFTKGIKNVGIHSLIAFGTFWLLIECPSFFFQKFDLYIKQYQSIVFVIVVVFSIFYGIKTSLPKIKIERCFKASNTKICLKVGDLLKEDCNIACTISDDFRISVSTNAINNQVLKIYFSGNENLFNKEVLESLNFQHIKGMLDSDKFGGQYFRYKIGTTGIIDRDDKKIFIVVSSPRLDKNGAEAQIETLQIALKHLWDKVRTVGGLKEISIPVFGTGLARLNFSHLILIQTIILSYVIYSRKFRISTKLNIIVHEKNYEPIEFVEAQNFLDSLLL